MYQIHTHGGDWPELDLADFLSFLETRLKLTEEDVTTLVLADDAFVQELNATYRQKDQPTNVLSFNADMQGELGDLIFGLETIQTEAKELSKPFMDHLKHLILHGSLHLLGYDHEDAAEAEQMEALEAQILGEYGLPNPYAGTDAL